MVIAGRRRQVRGQFLRLMTLRLQHTRNGRIEAKGFAIIRVRAFVIVLRLAKITPKQVGLGVGRCQPNGLIAIGDGRGTLLVSS